jgi:hypothetical protein
MSLDRIMEHQADATTTHDGQQAMQQACITGDLSALRKLLQKPSEQTPVVYELLTTAVINQHPKIVSYLLKTYPNHSLSQHIRAAESLCKTGNISILKILLDHESSFARISLDYALRCFITEACLSPAPDSQFIHMLLDAGADLHDGLGPGGGALLAAIMGGREKDIVVKIVKKGGDVNLRILYMAIQKERMDVLPLLLRKGEGKVDEEDLWKWAKETGNEEIKALVEDFREGGIKEMVSYEKESENEAGKKTGWWKWWTSKR